MSRAHQASGQTVNRRQPSFDRIGRPFAALRRRGGLACHAVAACGRYPRSARAERSKEVDALLGMLATLVAPTTGVIR
ncbi:MAG: hypothetical protein U0Q11_21405 [Vicinamibacterales bacterium]